MFGTEKTDKEMQELLRQLANKLSTSSHQLSEAARRLQLAELTYREYLLRLRRLDEHMNSLIELLQGPKNEEPAAETNPAFCEPPPAPQPKPGARKLRYAEYIEFSNYAELKKFEKMGEITEKDVADCDADDLMRKLLTEDPSR